MSSAQLSALEDRGTVHLGSCVERQNIFSLEQKQKLQRGWEGFFSDLSRVFDYLYVVSRASFHGQDLSTNL